MEFVTVVIYLSIYLGLIATTFFILSYYADKKKEKKLYSDSELPKVTIIIPAYNEEKSIEKTVTSILASDYPDFEVFVIDDGSTDKTFEIAKKFEGDKVKVFRKKNKGKSSALNFGIKKAKTELIFTMDADTRVDPNSMKKMAKYFKNNKVMCVVSAMVTEKPKTFLQRVQHIEYLMGLFLRTAFAAVDAIYITPGAFAGYRKWFFNKYGDFDEGNITEDLEMSLRIQLNGFKIENCPEAPAYTIAPRKFKELFFQRRRWYFGLIKNLIEYKKIISPKFGDLGLFVLPIAMLSIFFSVFVTIYFFLKAIFNVRKELLFLQNINFSFLNFFDINFYVIKRFLFLFFTDPIVISVLFFMIILGFFLYYASKKVKVQIDAIFNLILFFAFFSILFGFWWIVSLFYALFTRKIKWR